MAFVTDTAYIPVATILPNVDGIKQISKTTYVNAHTFLDDRIDTYVSKISVDISSATYNVLQNKFLKLDGGEVTGTISSNASPALTYNATNHTFLIGSLTAGAMLLLNGKNTDINLGYIQLIASKGDTSVSVIATPDGKLKFDNKNIVRSVGGLTANDAGNINLTAGFLPLSGGNMTGSINMNGQIITCLSSQALMLRSNTGVFKDAGAYLNLYGIDMSINAGAFELAAGTASEHKYFLGSPDGTLKWDNKNIVRSINSTLTADVNGNISITPDNIGAFPQTGGSITGATTITTGGLTVNGGINASGTVTISTASGFNYSGIATGTDNSTRPIWFSQDNSTNKGKPAVNTDLLSFNPNTKVLKVGDTSSSTVSFGDKVKLQWNSTTTSLDFNFI